jgi:2-polyprenyl-3-methyl-5-hydroxy-6-metoxy-1,4-benzoquinol methylase
MPPHSQLSRDDLFELWRHALTMDHTSDPTDAVVSELAEYFQLPEDEVRRRCIQWEDESVAEWQTNDRSTPEGLREFYQTQVSWIFDTMWYHANQFHRTAPAESVEIAWGLRALRPGHHLDFGAGPGTSSIFFSLLGWQVSLADISTSFQEFAKWRLKRHGVAATYYDNSRDEFPNESFDLITAFDVMVHVPNIPEALEKLHRALKPSGYFVFNIDNLPCTPRTAWHLYEDQYPILGKMRRTGFKRHRKITYFHVYQKCERSPFGMRLVRSYDRMRYNRYVTFVGNHVRWAYRQVRTRATS